MPHRAPRRRRPPLSFLSLPKNGHFFLLQHNGSPGRSQNDQAYLEVLAQAVEDRGCLDPPCCLEGEQFIYLENWARRQKLRKLPKLLTRIGDAQKKCFSCAHKLKAFFCVHQKGGNFNRLGVQGFFGLSVSALKLRMYVGHFLLIIFHVCMCVTLQRMLCIPK